MVLLPSISATSMSTAIICAERMPVPSGQTMPVLMRATGSSGGSPLAWRVGWAGSAQHEDGLLALGVSVAGGREADLRHDEAALPEDAEGSHVAGGGGGDQRAFRDLHQQEAQRPAGDPAPPVRPVDPVADVILP